MILTQKNESFIGGDHGIRAKLVKEIVWTNVVYLSLPNLNEGNTTITVVHFGKYDKDKEGCGDFF